MIMADCDVRHKKDRMSKPKAIALFCGAGGLSLGFKKAGYDVVFATDINHYALASYSAYFPNINIFDGDIRDLQPSSLPSDVDIILGGPPCQGFRSAGQQFWDDPRNKLLSEYVRMLDALCPKWFMMENVERSRVAGGRSEVACSKVASDFLKMAPLTL